MIETDTLLVDGDLLCYLSQDPDEPAQYILHSVKLMLEDMEEKTKCNHMRVFLSSPINFRYKVDPDYKISRKDVPKPPHYLTTKNYLIKYYDAEIADEGYEADDHIAKIMNEQGDKVTVATLDKDFLTVAGKHYKWRHHNAGEVFNVTEDDAEAYLCYQLLIGDKADSIISPLKKTKADGSLGKVGFGHVAARDFLLQYDYDEMRDRVYDIYEMQGHADRFIINYQLLAIGRIEV